MIGSIEGLRTIREVGKDDVIFVLMNIKCEDRPADNKGLMVPFYEFTFLYDNFPGEQWFWFRNHRCLPAAKVKEFFKLVGFNKVKRIETDHPLNAMYEIKLN